MSITIKVIDPNLIIVKNFLTSSFCDELTDSLNNLDDYEWESNEANTVWDKREVNINTFLSKKHSELIKDQIKYNLINRFDVNDIDISNYNIVRWRVGDSQTPHIDWWVAEEGIHPEKAVWRNEDEEQLGNYLKGFNRDGFTGYHFAAMTYLNNDFIGGEIYFPQYDLEIKPEKGMMVGFIGDQDHWHGVKEVVFGTRYVISSFWTDPNKYRA